MQPLVAAILDALPQTQCQRCGYPDCAAYAAAIADGSADINQCPPGGQAGVASLAALTGKTEKPLNPAFGREQERTVAFIDEDWCIGCTLCIKACPVDAIVGATKRMHDVIALECTGCGLCVPPCPVDCIDLLAVKDEFLPRVLEHTQVSAYEAATHAKQRFERRSLRLERLETRKQQEREAKRMALQAARTLKQSSMTQQASTTPSAAFDPLTLIAKATANASSQKKVEVHNQSEHVEEQLQAAMDAAAIRQAMRDIEFGSETEKQRAIQLLREQKKRRKQQKKH